MAKASKLTGHEMAASGGVGAGADSFAALLQESLGENGSFDGRVVKGRIVSIEGDFAIIDVGLKAEGRVALKEFGTAAEVIPVIEVDARKIGSGKPGPLTARILAEFRKKASREGQMIR
jgi:ribosomal protein S1